MSLFSLFGLRFGWSSVIGFIPWIGDVIDLYFAIQLVYLCQTVTGGLPPNITSKMWFNGTFATGPRVCGSVADTGVVAVDFALGLVPILGDLADASWRCNTKNVSVLERYLKEKHGPKDARQREMDGLEPFPEDVGMIDGVDKLGEQGGHAQYGTTGTAAPGQNMAPPTVQQQQQKIVQQNQGSRGWFGFGGHGGRQQDLEGGQETGVVNVRT